MQKKLSMLLASIILTTSAFAADPIAKEDTTTLSAAEPLTLAQIPPLTDSAKFIPGAQNKPIPAAPSAKPSDGSANSVAAPVTGQ